jgi:hydrogenase maturation protease
VLCFGNPLRGDDGAGWVVAEAVAHHWPRRVMVRVGQQLVPEWAADLAEADVVFFVDASPLVGEAELEALSTDEDHTPVDGHDLSPAQLLRLTRAAFGRSPRALVLSVPAVNVEFGQTLTPVAARGVARAVYLLHTEIAALILQAAPGC